MPTIGGHLSSSTGLMDAGALDQRCRKDARRREDERPLAARNDRAGRTHRNTLPCPAQRAVSVPSSPARRCISARYASLA